MVTRISLGFENMLFVNFRSDSSFTALPALIPKANEAFGCGISLERKRWRRSVLLLTPKVETRPMVSTTGDENGTEEEDEEDGVIDEGMTEKHGVQRYLLAVEYIGTRFSGSQWQPRCRTVVGVLQNFTGRPVTVVCSSRTDAGVHAISNVCHVDVERISKRRPGEVLPPYEPRVVRRAVNHFLQKNEGDIYVVDVRCVPSNIHARFNAHKRTYFYRLLSGRGPLPVFERGRAWHVSEELDVLSMQKACSILIGTHDFSSFRAARCQAKSPIRTLDELCVSEVASMMPSPRILDTGNESSMNSWFIGETTEFTGPSSAYSPCVHANFGMYSRGGQDFGQRRQHRCFIVTASSRSFLYHQVRLLVGALKSVGTGDLTVDDVETILSAKTPSACAMAPSCGLYLGHVKYDLL